MGESYARTASPRTTGRNLKLPAIGFFFEADQNQIARIDANGFFLFGGYKVKNRLCRHDSLRCGSQELDILLLGFYAQCQVICEQTSASLKFRDLTYYFS